MRKQIKKLFTLTLAMVMCFCTLAYAQTETASAAEPSYDVAPAFVAIVECGRLLDLDSVVLNTYKLNCFGYTDVYSGYTAEVVVELQQTTNNGNTWTTIKSWRDAPGMASATVDEFYYVASGVYRVKTSHYAYNSSGTRIETYTDNTEELYL